MTRCLRCQRRLPPSEECPDHGRATAVTDVPDAAPVAVRTPPGWVLGRPIASGGTALVYEIRRDGSPPAVMKFGRWRERDSRARFALEADVLREVGPPATPAYLDHGVIDDWPYLIMEHLPGETLAAWMSRMGDRGGIGEIVAILTRVAAALATLHAAGFVHRDLKPENIMIGGKGIRLLDFGLVRRPRQSARGLTQIGSVVGTPHYLAPEQIKHGGDVDHRADLYSFGVVAFEMFAGRPPFVGERRAIEYHHQVCRPPSVRETRAIPQALDDIVLACLAKQIESRPASADIVRAQLSDALSSLGTLRGMVSAPPPRSEVKLGAQGVVALAWIERGDPISVTRAITEVHGIVVRQRGDAILAAWSAQHHDAPLAIALATCRAMIGERRRVVIHLTTALVRRSAQGKVMVYGADLEQPDHWLPTVPFAGLVLTGTAAESVPGGVTPAPEAPGFFRETQRDRTDATDAKVEPRLIGREPMVRELAAAAATRPTLIVGISGPAGSGKTRVLRAISDRLAANGREVIRIAARRRLLGERPDDRVAAALARDAIIVVDDAHWLPTSQCDRLIAGPGVRIVASATAPFEVGAGATDRIAIELPPLSHADADTLLREMLRPAQLIPDPLVERLVIRGTGNPGLLIGLARDIKRRGAIRRQLGRDEWYVAVDELDTLLAPPSPAWFASRLLEDLPVELAPIARLCAGLGPRFSDAEVAAVFDGRDVAARLALLVREGLFVELDGGYGFDDLGMQHALYDHVLDERELVHRRAFGYWVTRDGGDPVERLARLAFHAAGSGQRTVAAACWTQLARHTSDPEQIDLLLASAGAFLAADLPPTIRGLLSTPS